MQNFYGKIFGWKFEDDPNREDYFYFSSPSGLDGGFEKNTTSKPGNVSLYIILNKVTNETLSEIVTLGGEILGNPETTGQNSGFVSIKDPEGNKIVLCSMNIQINKDLPD